MKYLILVLLLDAAPALAQDDAADAQALKELEGFLNDPAAKQAYGATHPDAKSTNDFFGKFPPYAQDELNAIVMVIMNESKAGASKHVDAYKKGGVGGAQASFSPAVKARVTALQTRLARDPAFNSPANLAMMKQYFPAFLGAPGS